MRGILSHNPVELHDVSDNILTLSHMATGKSFNVCPQDLINKSATIS